MSAYLYGPFDCMSRTHNHLASLAEWLSVRLRSKWLRVRVQLQHSHKKHIVWKHGPF